MVVNTQSQKGISLFVVISALLILSVLTISITAQLMAPTFAATAATRQIISENNFRSALQALRPIIRLVSLASAQPKTDLPKLDGSTFDLVIDERSQSFSLQDVNGLLDINSASQSLLSTFLIGLGQEARQENIMQRRANAPFRSVEEFALALGLNDSLSLQKMLTVNSGRRRINDQTAPLALLQILTQQNGSRDQLISQLDKKFLHTRPVTDVVAVQK